MVQDKNITPRKNIDQKARQTQTSTNRMKTHNSRTQHRTKPGQRRQKDFCKFETVDHFFLIKKSINQNIIPRGYVEWVAQFCDL